jgi:hypothetical protein
MTCYNVMTWFFFVEVRGLTPTFDTYVDTHFLTNYTLYVSSSIMIIIMKITYGMA